MPSFSEIIGVIVTGIVIAQASGHGDAVWKALAQVRKVAITNARQDFGCPSVFNKDACSSYDSRRYR